VTDAAPDPSSAAAPLLSVVDLHTTFHTPRGDLHAVDGVSFDMTINETVAIVGESGSGKTVLSRSIMGIQQSQNVQVSGSVRYLGTEVVGTPDAALRDLWGKEIAMIFQDPMTSLNPVMKVGKQISESLVVRMGRPKREAKGEAIELLRLVGIPSPEERFSNYPNQLSGGMRQRVVIAIALACDPKLLLADEPTTGLDVTVQAQILNLLSDLKNERDMSVILVTHDLGVVAHNTDRIIVMYAGRIVESGTTRQIFRSPRMHYTASLLDSNPSVSNPSHTRLRAIPGRPPDLLRLPPGCAFAPRCAAATDQCRVEIPPLTTDASAHAFACWNPIPADQVRARAVSTASGATS
jgi:oligopeptide/dipeptide ABC transporter ATP-binding protein